MPRLPLLALVALLSVPAAAQETIDVTVSRQGYRPASLRLKKGETTRISLRTSDEEHCFAVNALRIEKRIRPGKATTFDLTPDKAGDFPYYCCLEPDNETLRGRLLVTE